MESLEKIIREKPNSGKSKIEEKDEKRVRDEIGFALQKCYQMGGNDCEHDLFKNILQRYKEGYLTADEAIREARAIPENKIER